MHQEKTIGKSAMDTRLKLNLLIRVLTGMAGYILAGTAGIVINAFTERVTNSDNVTRYYNESYTF